MPPGSASASRRAATLTPSPKMSSSSTMTSPRLIPMRNLIRRSSDISGSRSAIPRWISAAQRTASTTLANSAKKPSPVFFTIRPRCSAIFGLTSSRRWAWSRSCVPSSSAPISREYATTFAARIAVRRRTEGIVARRSIVLTKPTPKSVPALAFSGPGGLKRDFDGRADHQILAAALRSLVEHTRAVVIEHSRVGRLIKIVTRHGQALSISPRTPG
jgi:hypothetical protein